jgi:hypothetical protein
MKKNLYGVTVLALAHLALCQCSAQTTNQPKGFTDWPPGLSPAEVGKKLATNMVPPLDPDPAQRTLCRGLDLDDGPEVRRPDQE